MARSAVLVLIATLTYAETLEQRFAPPSGHARVEVEQNSFGAWLRRLPLAPPGTPVLLFDGSQKSRQDVHAAVIELDVGTRDLQQCADAVMRLRAEWLYAAGRAKDVSFNDTGKGAPMTFAQWATGERPRAKGNTLVWNKTAAPNDSRDSFRAYLDTVFVWAGTSSLERQLKPRAPDAIAPGDVVIKGGFPGHAVIVLDVARTDAGVAKVLLGQSYMPAQSIHVLQQSDGGAWFAAPTADAGFETPEWSFPRASLRTW